MTQTRSPRVTVDTRDPDRAAGMVGSAYCPHRLNLGRGRERFRAVQTETTVGDVAVHHLSYGADVGVEPGPLGRWVLASTPVRGALTVRSGRAARTVTPGETVVFDALREFTLEWHDSRELRTVRLPAAVVDDSIRDRGVDPVRHARFSLEPAVSVRAARSWLGAVDMAEREARRGGPFVESGLLAAQFTRMMAGLLVETHPAIDGDGIVGAGVAPRHLRAAVEFIERNAAQDVTLSSIARASGVGVRALQVGFRQHLDTTPTAYLRDHRLQRAHEVLVQAHLGDGSTVADVAHTWGFGNLGRFARAYRERFGCTPMETLRR